MHPPQPPLGGGVRPLRSRGQAGVEFLEVQAEGTLLPAQHAVCPVHHERTPLPNTTPLQSATPILSGAEEELAFSRSGESPKKSSLAERIARRGRPSGVHDHRDNHQHQSSIAFDDESCWPLLSRGRSSSTGRTRVRTSWGAGCCLERREFSLEDAGSWPPLHGSKAGVSVDGISLSLDAGSGATAGLAGGDDRVILATKASTHQQQRGYAELRRSNSSTSSFSSTSAPWERSRSRGWMRLPPIVMVNGDEDERKNCNKRGFGEVGESSGAIDGGGEKQQQLKCGELEGRGGDTRQHGYQSHGVSPVLLMLNTDFVVTSPLRENLLLTLALTQKGGGEYECCDDGSSTSSSSSSSSSRRVRRQVLVGRFEALSSFVRFGLGRDAKRVVTECNAGGTSTISESLSVEYFVRRFQAREVVTEMEVEYCSMNWKKVDYICNLYGRRVGVSVTRAMSYPNPQDFSPQMAYRLLYKKLFGLVVARHGVTDRHSFSLCILHVWCETRSTAEIVEAQYRDVSEELDIKDDVIMVLTVAEGWHARPIFYESCLSSR